MSETKVCIKCGRITDPSKEGDNNETLCSKCFSKFITFKRSLFYCKKRKNGWIPESAKRAGRKAYYTRLANLYFNDRKRFDKLFKKLKEKAPGRAGAVTRRINAIRNNNKR